MQAFETEGLIGTGAAPAVLAYLFHRIEERLDGRPTLLIVDEGWLALDDPTFGAQIPRMAEDAAQEERLRRLRHPVAGRHRDQRDRARDHRELPDAALPARTSAPSSRRSQRSTGASASTTGRSRSSPAQRPSATITASRAAAIACSSSDLGEVALAFTAASSKTDQAAIAEVMLEHGRDGFAAAWLRRKGLDWAADLINAELTTPHNAVTPSLWAIP